MKAFTVYPWWAFAFTQLFKNVENRSWSPSSNQLAHGEWVAIHAGARTLSGHRHPETNELIALIDDAKGAGWEADVQDFGTIMFTGPEDRAVVYHDPTVTRSAVVAIAQYNGSTQGIPMPWGRPDGFQWRFSSVLPLDAPVPIRGKQGLWTLSEGVVARIAEQVPAAVMS